MIHVIATIELVSGVRDAYLVEFHDLVPRVRLEEGCLEYGPAVDLETGIPAQASPRPDVVVVLEKWASLATLEAHLRAEHMVAFRARVKPLVKSTCLRILAPA
jgi:quinol monooxygenase YgiN